MKVNQTENAYFIARRGYRCGQGQKYFEDLYQAILKEMRLQGFCTYLDRFYYQQIKSIDVIEMSVLLCVKHYYETGMVYNMDREYVPGIESKGPLNSRRYVTWRECREWGYSTMDLPGSENVFASIIENGRRKHLEYLDELEERKAVKSEEKFSATLESEKSKLLSEAKQEAVDLREKARVESKEIKHKAEAEALEIVRNAEKQAEEIRQKARQDASQEALIIKEEAKKQEEERKNEQCEKAREIADKMILRNIAKAQKAMRQDLAEELEHYQKDSKEKSEKIDEIHSKMCKETNQLQAQWVTTLDDTYAKLNELKTDFYKVLRDWQTSLYPSEYRPIAERYIELYRILNLDKMLREEVFYQEKKIEDDKPEAQPAPETIQAVERLNTSLMRFLKKFEQSMAGLGLYVYFPKQGDEFDELFHYVNDNEMIDPYGSCIEQCITPGVKKASQFDREGEVVIPAEVTVKEKSQEGDENRDDAI